jgi:hypothetical protein
VLRAQAMPPAEERAGRKRNDRKDKPAAQQVRPQHGF